MSTPRGELPAHIAAMKRAEERRKDPAWNVDPIHGPMADFFAAQEPWTREKYDRLCKEWHCEFESHKAKAEPSRARQRREGTKRVRVFT